MMGEVAAWATLIAAVTGLLVALGKGVAWAVALLLDQANKTIAALKEENEVLKERARVCETEHGP